MTRCTRVHQSTLLRRVIGNAPEWAETRGTVGQDYGQVRLELLALNSRASSWRVDANYGPLERVPNTFQMGVLDAYRLFFLAW